MNRRCHVVEHWNSFARKRNDLFGFIDIVALSDKIVGIQCTSGSNVSARVKKILDECQDAAREWLQAGGAIEVWGWRKISKERGSKVKIWDLRIEQITLEMLTVASR
jgi:hypothetical protein